MASADAEEWGSARVGSPGGSGRRSSDLAKQQKLGRSGFQTGRSLNVKDRSYNQLRWEMDRRKPDWRMRSASDDGEAMISSPERGPLGPGGIVRRRSPAHRGGTLSGRGDSEG